MHIQSFLYRRFQIYGVGCLIAHQNLQFNMCFLVNMPFIVYDFVVRSYKELKSSNPE